MGASRDCALVALAHFRTWWPLFVAGARETSCFGGPKSTFRDRCERSERLYFEVQISLQVQHFVNLEVQISWQAQHFVNLEAPISWQAQHFVNLEVQISRAGAAFCEPRSADFVAGAAFCES